MAKNEPKPETSNEETEINRIPTIDPLEKQNELNENIEKRTPGNSKDNPKRIDLEKELAELNEVKRLIEKNGVFDIKLYNQNTELFNKAGLSEIAQKTIEGKEDQTKELIKEIDIKIEKIENLPSKIKSLDNKEAIKKREFSPTEIEIINHVSEIFGDKDLGKNLTENNFLCFDIPENLQEIAKGKLGFYSAKEGKIFINSSSHENFVNWDGSKIEGASRDYKQFIGHELGHALISKGVLLDRNELMNIEYYFSNPRENKDVLSKMSPELQDIITIIEKSEAFGVDGLENENNPGNIESNHIKSLLSKLVSEKDLLVENTKYNKRVGSEIDLETFRKIYRNQIAHEIYAERLSFYMISENKKDPSSMLKEQLKKTPEKLLKIYLGLGENDIDASTLEKVRSGDKETLDKLDKNEKFKAKFTKLQLSNKKFYDRFNNTIGKLKSDQIKEILINGDDMDIDDLDDMISGDSGYSRPSVPSNGDRSFNFIDALFDIMDKVQSGGSGVL